MRRDPKMLTKYLNEPAEFEKLVSECHPAQKITYKLFDLQEFADADKPKNTRLQRCDVSQHDPFLGGRPAWKPMHRSVQRTENLIKVLEPFESKRLTDQRNLSILCDLDQRFEQT